MSNTEKQIPYLLLATFVMAILLFFAYEYFINPPHALPTRVICGVNLSTTGKALLLYIADYNDKYPTPQEWCDLLISYADASPKALLCKGSDAVLGESSYAFNKFLVGKKPSEVPLDVVVLFETNYGKTEGKRDATASIRECIKLTGPELQNFFGKNPERLKVYKDRWNQVGGPEILTADNHKSEGANFLFSDGHVSYCQKEDFGELNWGIDINEPNFLTETLDNKKY